MAADPLVALRAESERVSGIVLGLGEENFSRPTRCEAWNVKELLAHMHRDVDRINTALDEPPPPAADADAVTYWRSYDPAVDAPSIAERAKAVADSFDSGQALAAAWDEMWRRALGRAATEDRSRIVITWGPALSLDDLLRTRVLEITVHGTDLARALDLPVWSTEAGVEVTEEIMLGLLDPEPPAGQPWEAVTFLEKGAGRIPLSDDDRRQLGPLAERFPLLG